MIRYINLMMNAIQKIEKVVSGLLNFSRQADYHLRPFDLHGSIDRALSLVEYKLEKSEVEIERNFDQKIKTYYGDSQHFEQVVINLVLNAMDAMPQGGKLSISTLAHNSKIRMEIEDTGTGIPQKSLSRIFDPFFTTKEPGKGTGLGLSVTYNIIQEHDGDIAVESKENMGTKFIITLP